MNPRPALLLATLLFIPLLATAQPPGPGPGGSPERMTEHLVRKLGLDEQQAAKLKTLNERHGAEMTRLRAEHEKALRELLTPEQWTQFEQMKKDMHERRRGRTSEATPGPA